MGWQVEVAQKAGCAVWFWLREGKYLISQNQVTQIWGFSQGVGGRAEGDGGGKGLLGAWGTKGQRQEGLLPKTRGGE